MAWFYVAEQPSLGERWARQVFGDAMPAIARENVTSRNGNGREAVVRIAPATLRVIEQKNTSDTALYDHACRRLAQQASSRRRWFFWQ